jgi:hypothetical protein
MRFPPLDELPPLTAPETESWFYPTFQGRPYTEAFANRVIDFITLEEEFWRHLKYVKQADGYADIYFDLLAYGTLSLPEWSFSIQDQTFEGSNEATTLHVQVDTSALLKMPNEPELMLDGDYSSRISSLGQLVKHLLPYMEAIYIVTDEDQASFLIPS